MQEQNIIYIIGDNASGKTRYLKNIIADAKKNNYKVVTNIPGDAANYAVNKERLTLLKSLNNRLVEKIVIEKNIETSRDAYIEKLFRLFYSIGDILVIDELDINLTIQNIIDITAALSEIRKTWKKIYINGGFEK